MSDKQKLSESVKNAVASVDTTQLEASAKNAKDSLKNSVESVSGSVAGQVEGGVKSLTQKFDKYQDKLSNVTTEGLIDDGIQSLEGMKTAFVDELTSGLASKFGSAVNITFSEPDSNGVVVPIQATLDAEGGVSGTVGLCASVNHGSWSDSRQSSKSTCRSQPSRYSRRRQRYTIW